MPAALAAAFTLPVLASPAAQAETYSAKAATIVAPGNLVISSSTYAGTATTITVGQALPVVPAATAIANGSYPGVFANDTVDANFGITSPITLTGYATFNDGGYIIPGRVLGTLNVTALTGICTSFSSKSELSLHVSTDNTAITLMGYKAPINAIDISDTNTPGNADPTNSDTATPTYRAVVDVNTFGYLSATATNAYSGNNGRGAVLSANTNGTGANEYLMVGNGGNGSSPPPVYVVDDTGAQLIDAQQASPNATVVGMQQGTPGAANGFQFGFSVANPPVSAAADKSGKDDNFRGITVFNQTEYVTKGSGSNGVNTVYQVSPAGGGLPTKANASGAVISILPGFPTILAKTAAKAPLAQQFYPFGLYFANSTTLYVADEGPQALAGSPNGGLQKWIFNGTTWTLAYTLQAGLNLGTQYAVAGYPTEYNPATTGLRNISGYTQGNVVTIFATTSTYSNLGDPGADPNQVVEIVDSLSATTLPAGESFTTVVGPTYGVVYRGVAYIP
jgi:hypothetical protein